MFFLGSSVIEQRIDKAPTLALIQPEIILQNKFVFCSSA